MMHTTIDAPAKCNRSPNRFLQVEGNIATEIHPRLCDVYGENIISDSAGFFRKDELVSTKK